LRSGDLEGKVVIANSIWGYGFFGALVGNKTVKKSRRRKYENNMKLYRIMKCKTLFIALLNYLIFSICLILMLSPLGFKPGAMHPLLIVPFFYLMFSIIPAVFGVIVGVFELNKINIRKFTIAGLLLNGLYAGIFILALYLAWPAMMSV
jgi:hypothetical protein